MGVSMSSFCKVQIRFVILPIQQLTSSWEDVAAAKAKKPVEDLQKLRWFWWNGVCASFIRYSFCVHYMPHRKKTVTTTGPSKWWMTVACCGFFFSVPHEICSNISFVKIPTTVMWPDAAWNVSVWKLGTHIRNQTYWVGFGRRTTDILWPFLSKTSLYGTCSFDASVYKDQWKISNKNIWITMYQRWSQNLVRTSRNWRITVSCCERTVLN